MSNLEVVVGGQFGSEGKGAITAWRSKEAARRKDQVLGIRVAGPNAGHTVIGDKGVDTSGTVAPNLCEPVGGNDEFVSSLPLERFAWRLRQVPVAAVEDPNAVVALAAGSEIDLDVLINEVECLDAAGYAVSERLYVDDQVTLILDRHKYDEKYGRGTWDMVEALDVNPATYSPDGPAGGIATVLGSTGKGIGAARADRLWRAEDVLLLNSDEGIDRLRDAGIMRNDVGEVAQSFLRQQRATVLIEGTQGYGLGIHAGYYPYCTSSDCRAVDFLAMSGISPWISEADLSVWVCIRPYPIRVGGNSGPLRSETTWEALGLPEEHTTVTGKVRRVGQWDGDLARRAIVANGGPGGPVNVVVTMLDTIVPGIAGWSGRGTDPLQGPGEEPDHTKIDASLAMAKEIEWLSRECLSPIAAVGTGPDTVLDLRDPA